MKVSEYLEYMLHAGNVMGDGAAQLRAMFACTHFMTSMWGRDMLEPMYKCTHKCGSVLQESQTSDTSKVYVLLYKVPEHIFSFCYLES